ncbi:MAG: U32 family peptidase [Treponema sp.]|jgi:putative protease|nr:U32 family peptidase [Treponema sp.]
MNPELLAPAGSPEALDAAVASGADAVYLGLKDFNARLRSANFSYSQFESALRALHRMNRRVYVTVNTVFEAREADRMYQLLKYLSQTGPDAVIVQDYGVIMMAREFPALKLHASTQMNIASARGANCLSKFGLSRAVLARELSLEEIHRIADGTNVELEVFVHGALCVCVSGLCLFSSYLGGKSANRGLCTQACRRLYHTGEEDPETGYFFSPGDLSLISRIPDLKNAGVKSFKIEGRMKSAEYVGCVVSAYRRVIDSLEGSDQARHHALEEAQKSLQNDFARPKTEYLAGVKYNLPDRYPGDSAAEDKNADKNNVENNVEKDFSWLRPEQDSGTGISLGTISAVKGTGAAYRVKLGSRDQELAPHKTVKGDSVRFHKADDSLRLSHKLVFAEDRWISAPEEFGIGDHVYLIQTRAMTKRYPQLIGPAGYTKRQPGHDRAPPPVTGPGSTHSAKLPEGFYVAVSSAEDLFMVQSIRPRAVILPVNQKTAKALLENKLPFGAESCILNLDPFFSPEDEAFLAETIPDLEKAGYTRFMLNNPAHFSFFARNRGKRMLIGGPWLYGFNPWSAAFIAALGADALVSPLENNRQNLEKTAAPRLRSRFLVTLFAWPPLYRIRADLRSRYSFSRFSDSRDEQFMLIGGKRSVVIPEKPFSIIDKRPFLEEAGFRRFILDFSGGSFDGSFPLKKKLYKEVMTAAQNAQPLSNTTRFNWKNGFFYPDQK